MSPTDYIFAHHVIHQCSSTRSQSLRVPRLPTFPVNPAPYAPTTPHYPPRLILHLRRKRETCTLVLSVPVSTAIATI